MKSESAFSYSSARVEGLAGTNDLEMCDPDFSRKRHSCGKAVFKAAEAMFHSWYPRTVARLQIVVYIQKPGLAGNICRFLDDSSRVREKIRLLRGLS